jgi:uncharacterized protein YdaU (DUF1376 family)
VSRKEKNNVETYMPLVIEKYHGDTQHLTTLQHGAYLLLLMAYWRTGTALPAEDDQLRTIARLDRSEWKKVKPVLRPLFEERDGRWFQKRAEMELERARKKREAAIQSARARWGNDPSGAADADAGAMRTHTVGMSERNAPPSSIAVEANASPAEPPAKAKRKILIPKDWRPHDRHREKALALGLDCDLEAEKMRHWADSGGARCEQWDARFFSWLHKAVEIGHGKGQHGRGGVAPAGKSQRDIQLAAAVEAARRAGSGYTLWDADQPDGTDPH